jgi:hypothetical protein
MENRKNNIITLIIILLVIPILVWLIFGSFDFSVKTRLFSGGFFGFIVAFLVLYLQRVCKLFDKLAFGIISIISSLAFFATLCIALFSNNAIYQLDNIFDKQITIDIGKEFKNKNEPHIIFAFDETTYNDSPTIDESNGNDDLPVLYNTYINKIQRFCNITPELKNITYREFFKAKLCSDLIDFMEYNSTFSIYVIGNKIEEIVSESRFTEKDIRQAINKLYSELYDSDKTDFKQFYHTMHLTIQQFELQKEEFVKYVLYAYSDFVHDLNGKSIFSDLIEIEKYCIGNNETIGLRKKSIIQNLYISPYNIKLHDDKKKYIFNWDGSLYDRRTKIKDEIRLNNDFGNSIHNLKYTDIPLYYSDNKVSSPNLYFSDGSYKIKIHELDEEFSSIKLINLENGTDTIDLYTITYREIKANNKYAIKFGGTKIEKPIILDVAQENVHVFLELKIEQNKTNILFLKILIMIFVFFCGFCLTVEVMKKFIPFLIKNLLN